MRQEQLNYTLILHQIRKKLKLSLMEYCIADSVYHLSNNPKSKIQGWCYAPKESIASFLGTTRATIFDNLNKLIKKDLIEKDDDTKYLRTTQKWYDNVVILKTKAEYQETLHTIKKLDTPLSRNLTPDYQETLHNIYNNKDNNKTISKDIRKQVSYGDNNINTLMDFLKEKLGGSPDGTIKENRRYAHLLLNRMKKDYPDKNSVDLIKLLIKLGIKDDFHGKNLTSFKYLYRNAQKIIQKTKSRIKNPKYIKI